MNKAVIFITILASCVLFQSLAFAEYLYVRPNGGSYGSENGSDWSNAFDGFSDISWGSGAGNLGPGDTVFIAGGNYSQSILLGGSGGGEGTRIIMKRATVSVHGTDTGWNAGFDAVVNLSSGRGISGNGRNYVTIDGVTAYGIKINASSSDGTRGIDLQTSEDYLTFKYIWIDGTNNDGDFRALRSYHYGEANASTGCIFNHMKFTYISNDCFALYNIDEYLLEYIVVANKTNSVLGKHGDLIECELAGEMVVRWSTLDWSGDQIQIGMGVGTGRVSGPWYIYGNISENANSFFKTNSKNPSGNGPVYMYNNVVVESSGTAIRPLSTPIYIFNNIYKNNVSDGTTGTTPYIDRTDPFVNYAPGNYSLSLNTVSCINKGIDVSSMYWWDASFCDDRDMNGNVWGADGYWDIGAIEYITENPNDLQPKPPDNLRIIN